MSLENNSVTQLETVDEPAVEDGPRSRRSIRSMAEDAVPVRDPVTVELERERADRVRTIVGSRGRRAGLPRVLAAARRRPASTVGVVSVGLVVTLVAILGGGGSGQSGTDASAMPDPGPARNLAPAAAPTSIPSHHARPAARRRATLAADRRVARRRARHGRRARAEARHRKSRERHLRRGTKKPAAEGTSVSAPAPSSESEPVAEELSVEEPTTTEEAAPEPEAEETPASEPAETAEVPPSEPADTPASTTGAAPSRTQAESEFDFER